MIRKQATKLNQVALETLFAKRTGTVNPVNFPDEVFDLYSIPAFDRKTPDVVSGSEIGSSKQIVIPGDVLLSKIVPHIRRSWVVAPANGRRLIASGEWIVFRSNEFYSPYVRHFVTSDRFHSQFMKTISGIGGSLLRARPAHVGKLEIPLPSLEDQKRIAYLLSKVEGLIAQRKQHLQQLDDLLKSVFHDMFGDPTVNERDWETDILANVTAEKIGYGIVQPGNPVDDGIPCIRVGDFVGIHISPTAITKVARDVSIRHKSSILKGDEILLACVGATIGKVALVDDHHRGHNIVRATARIRVSKKVNRLFLAYFLLTNFAQRYYVRVTRAVGQPTLNIKQINELPVFIPPIPNQIEFANRVEQAEVVRNTFQDSLHLLQDLIDQLSDQAFKGELDLSQVVVPDAEIEPSNECVAGHDNTSSVESTFELPAPAKGKKYKSSKSRKSALKSWLNAYTKHLGKQQVDADLFVGLVKQKLSYLESDSDIEWYSHEIGVAEYDEIKKWIFEELEGNRLSQFYDDKTNRVRVSAVKD